MDYEASSDQLRHLLILFAKHGSKLSFAHRAQQAIAARALLLTLRPTTLRTIAGFTLCHVSEFLEACERPVKASQPSIADEELALEAIFSLISSACGCVSTNTVFEIARDDSPEKQATSKSLTQDAVGGLFGNVQTTKSPLSIPGMILPSSFANSMLSLSVVRASLREATGSVRVAAGHILDVACRAALDQRALRIRTAALSAIAALVRVLNPRLLAAFFPGVASKLLRVLSRVRLEQSVIAVVALDALSVLVAAVFPVSKPISFSGTSFSEMISALQTESSAASSSQDSRLPQDRIQPQDLPMRAPDLIERTNIWYSNASKKFSQVITVLLEAPDGPRLHSNPRTRTAFVKFLGTCVLHDTKLQIDDVVRSECFVALFEAAADHFEEPRRASAMLLDEGLNRSSVHAQFLESGFKTLLSYISKLQEAVPVSYPEKNVRLTSKVEESYQDAQAESLKRMLSVYGNESRWSLVLQGYLFILGKSGLTSVLLRVDGDLIAQALVTYQKSVFRPKGIEAPRDYELLRTPALDSCAILGKAYLLPSLFGHFINVAETQMHREGDGLDENSDVGLAQSKDVLNHEEPADFMNHAHAVQCIQALIIGSSVAFEDKIYLNTNDSSEADDWEQLKRYTVNFLHCAAACTLPFNDEANTRSVWADTVPLRAKQCVLMSIAQLFNVLGRLRNKRRRLGFELVLPILLSLLVDAAREDRDIHRSAMHALERLAEAVGYDSVRELIERHINFIVARLVRNLHSQWAGAVLRFVIGSEHDAICERVVALSQDTLIQQCNDLAGASDVRVDATLSAIDSVLSAAIYARVTPKPKSSSRSSFRPGAPSEITELENVMMRYCLDEIVENETRTANESEDSNTEVGNVDSKSPFELVAVSALRGVADVLIGRPALLRSRALSVASKGIDVLLQDEKALLPEIATLLPLLPSQLHGKELTSNGERATSMYSRNEENKTVVVAQVNALGRELPTIAAACTLISGLVRAAPNFVKKRFVELVFPRLRPLLHLVRVGVTADASFGALAAADAALECMATVAEFLPDALAPFAEELTRCVLPYLSGSKEAKAAAVAGNLARKRYELQRMQRRMGHASDVIRGCALSAPDTVWLLLVIEEGSIGTAL